MRLVGIASLLIAPLLFAGDFWKDKKSEDWSEKEVKHLNSSSPWARHASVSMDGPGLGMGRGTGIATADSMGSGGRAGGRGGGMGRGGEGDGTATGRTGGMGGGPEMSAPKMPEVIVRWQSAEPMVVASVRGEQTEVASKVAAWAKEFYVITTRRQGGSGGPAQIDPSRMQQMQERMKQATALKRKGKDPIAPAKIEIIPTSEGMVTAYLFPRSAEISADDKDVTFETRFGPMQVKAKFSLKDMVYDGKLAL